MKLLRISLALVLLAAAFAPPSSLAGRLEDKKEELQRIKREMAEKKRKLRRAGKREQSVLGEIERIDKAIQSKDADLSAEQKRLREAEVVLSDTERDAAVTETELRQLRTTYGVRLRALYKMGRSGYAVGLFTTDSMSDAVKRVKYLELIARQDRAVIAEYRTALSELTERQTEIRSRKEEISRRRVAIASRQEDLEQQRRKKEKLLSSVRREKDLYEQVLDELEESSKDLWTMIKREEEESRRAAARTTRGAVKPTVSSAGRGRLPWPVDGRVVTPYGRQRHPEFGTVVFRRGIEIEVREGEPIRAVSSGKAVYAGWYKGYGKLLILEHGGGIYSLYGYLLRLDVQKGDAIAGRQVIGLAGDTGSLKGSKLYFEIRRGSDAEDPLAWLAPRRSGRR